MSSTAFIVIRRMTRNLFGDFLLKRLLTDFRGGDLSGRCRYPLGSEKVPQISQIYTDFSWDVFQVTQISQMTQIFSSDDTEFRRGDLSGRCRYPLGSEKVPQISQIYTDFSWDVFQVTQISQMTQIFSSDDTEFRRGDLSGRCRYPLRSEKAIRLRFKKICVYL